jgi:hypothetical protein
MKKFNLIDYKMKYVDFYINVDSNLFFPKIEEGWDDIIINNNRLIVNVTMNFGTLGIEGDFAVGIPPIDKDVTDAWDYCRRAGRWDWYTAFSYILKINNDSFDLQIFNISNSLFLLDPLKIKDEFNLNKYKDLKYTLLISSSSEHEGEIEEIFEKTLNEFMKILKIEFDANLVEKPEDIII